VSAAPETILPEKRPASSYLEIEISGDRLYLFERQGDGKTAELEKALARYGLKLRTRISSPCG
jgi:hypothetical protein